jgi:NAD(P)-dependent dehydrogenase (short-subunit alcohol dehydrogenase family)
VVVVTGAGRGIGRAIAIAFGSAGAHVACISRTRSEIESVTAVINASAASRALPIVYDLSDISGISGLIADIHQNLGKPVNILVNNAGIARIDALECQLDMGIWQQVIATNLTSPVALTCELLPSMLARGSGTIMSIGSRNAVFDIPYASAYSAAKTALLKFHQNLECEIGGRGVCSYYLQPGNIETSIIDGPGVVDNVSLDCVEGVRRAMSQLSNCPKSRPERVADACIILATHQDSPLLSGLCIDLDRNIDEMVEDLRKGRDSICMQRKLYKLKVETL